MKNYYDWSEQYHCIDTYCGVNRISWSQIAKEAYEAGQESAREEIQLDKLELIEKRYESKLLNEVNEKLHFEIISLKNQVETLKKCVEFYANKENWSYFDIHSWSTGESTPRGDTECLEGYGNKGSKSYGGKLARETLKKLNRVGRL